MLAEVIVTFLLITSLWWCILHIWIIYWKWMLNQENVFSSSIHMWQCCSMYPKQRQWPPICRGWTTVTWWMIHWFFINIRIVSLDIKVNQIMVERILKQKSLNNLRNSGIPPNYLSSKYTVFTAVKSVTLTRTATIQEGGWI